MIFNINVFIILRKYFFQLKDFSFHSIIIPSIKIIINLNLQIDHLIKLEDVTVEIKGKIITISTSKIIKIIAIKKNCIENDKRELLKKLNPHSNGVDFSFFLLDFFDKIIVIIISMLETIMEIKADIVKIKI